MLIPYGILEEWHPYVVSMPNPAIPDQGYWKDNLGKYRPSDCHMVEIYECPSGGYTVVAYMGEALFLRFISPIYKDRHIAELLLHSFEKKFGKNKTSAIPDMGD